MPYHVVERRDAGERLVAAERVGGELAERRRHGHGGRVLLLCRGWSLDSRVWEVVELVAPLGGCARGCGWMAMAQSSEPTTQ